MLESGGVGPFLLVKHATVAFFELYQPEAAIIAH